MTTVEEIQTTVKAIQVGSYLWNRKEIGELPGILVENEIVEAIILGMYNTRNGLLISTNKRMFFIDRGLIWGLKVEDFSYNKISSIQYNKGIIFGEITIMSSGNTAKIEKTDKDSCSQFCEHVRNRISTSSISDSLSSTSSIGITDNLIEKLKQLGELKAQGILTDEEFILAKQKLLQ